MLRFWRLTLRAGARSKLRALRENGTAGAAMDADTIKLMAEFAWLAYEEGCEFNIGKAPLPSAFARCWRSGG